MVPKTRVFQAADGKRCGDRYLAPFLTDPTHVTDRWTDGQTELQWLGRPESSSCFRA